MASSDSTVKFELYRYSPSLIAAAIFVILFGVASAVHAWQLIRVRSWYLVPLLVGGLCECLPCLPPALLPFPEYEY